MVFCLSIYKDISSSFANKLEYALDIPCSYFLRLQANYDSELACYIDRNNISKKEYKLFEDLKNIYLFRNVSDIFEMRKMFGISNLLFLKSLIELKNVSSSYLDGAIIRYSDIITRNIDVINTFDINNKDFIISSLKGMMPFENDDVIDVVKDQLSRYGIAFDVRKYVEGSNIKACIFKRVDSAYQIVIYLKENYINEFWFTLFHELYHLFNSDLKRNKHLIDLYNSNSNSENKANMFALENILDINAYNAFVKNKEYSKQSIEKFSQDNKLCLSALIDRLIKDNKISNGIKKYSLNI